MSDKLLSEKYIHHRNLLTRGQIELGIILALLNTGMLLGIFLKSVLGIATSLTFLITISSVLIVGICEYLFGWFYERAQLFDIENTWLTDRTPVLKRIEKMVEDNSRKEVMRND